MIAQTGNQFDLSSAQGKMIAGVLAVLSQFERDLIGERTKSGLALAKSRGKKLGRQHGQNPSDKIAPKVLNFVNEGRSYRWIAHELQISPTTVMQIVKRQKAS